MELGRLKIVADGITVANEPAIGKIWESDTSSATPLIACYVNTSCTNGSQSPDDNICTKNNNSKNRSKNLTSIDGHGKFSGLGFDGEETQSEGNERSRDGYACPPHGSVSICGRRREMEDALTVVPSFVDFPDGSGARRELHFFAVYDGHGGQQAAFTCRDRLHQILAAELINSAGIDGRLCGFDDGARWQEIMAGCFRRTDAEVGVGRDGNQIVPNSVAGTDPDTAGSTAVVAVVASDQIVVANCGDSRAVLSRGGTAVPLSVDHKPDRPDEMARIESAGGKVIFWNGPRVIGVLATSRSIGDRYLQPYVIAEPEVTCSRRSRDDECLILASDGLWDVLSNEIVCHIARKCLAGGGRTRKYCGSDETPAAMAASVLTKLALARGSCDNISVVVVDLMNSV